MGKTKNFYRLFMVPGMSHCGGGLGANVFGNGVAVPQADAAHDVVMALDQWVAQTSRRIRSLPPASLTATRPKVSR